MTTTRLIPHPLYEVTWRDSDGHHEIRVEKEAAWSLYRALDEAPGFYRVTLPRSEWSSFEPEGTSPSGEAPPDDPADTEQARPAADAS